MSIRGSSFLLVSLFGALQGCSSTPRFDDHFGASVRANLSAQVINPAAAANADPVSGMDGAAARAAQERYQRSFNDSSSAGGNTLQLVVGNGTK
jgi:hypothetical protein